MESLVEGVFGRAFRRQIHPVEIAKGLTKQMDEGRMVSISRTYAPNDFTVHLSQEDAESIRAYQDSLKDELIQYASTHAENKSYHLMTPPKIRFETEESLRFGEFGVTAKLTGGEGPREKGAPQDTSGQTRIFKTEDTGGGEPEGTAAISADEARRHGGAGAAPAGRAQGVEPEDRAGGEPEGAAAIPADEARRHGLAREIAEVVLDDGT